MYNVNRFDLENSEDTDYGYHDKSRRAARRANAIRDKRKRERNYDDYDNDDYDR